MPNKYTKETPKSPKQVNKLQDYSSEEEDVYDYIKKHDSSDSDLEDLKHDSDLNLRVILSIFIIFR